MWDLVRTICVGPGQKPCRFSRTAAHMVSVTYFSFHNFTKMVRISHFGVWIKMSIYRSWHVVRVQTSGNKSGIFFKVSAIKTAAITKVVHTVTVFVGGGLVRETDCVLFNPLVLLIFVREDTRLGCSAM